MKSFVKDTVEDEDAIAEYIFTVKKKQRSSSSTATGRHKEFLETGKQFDSGTGEEPRDDSSEQLAMEENAIGFGGHAEAIRKLLLEEESSLSVISIVGMAGQGKTTLAKKVYNDPVVRKGFGYRAWAPVSQQYIWRNVLQEITKTESKSKEEDTDESMLKEKLCSTLKKKKFLIVLDDVWHSDPLDDLVQIFGDNRNASRIVVTSRFKIVPERHNPRLYELTPLSDEQSWELLSKYAGGRLMQRMAAQKSKLTPLFKGVPLSVVIFARVLQCSSTPRAPDSFDMLNSYLCEHNDWKERLALSYEHLPLHLKPCFLYFGVFPTDYEIRARRLMRLWLAEGFLEPKDYRSLEQTAEAYLEELVRWNLIEVSKKRCDGGIRTCRVHAALQAFCKTKLKEEFPRLAMMSSPPTSWQSSASSPLSSLLSRFGIKFDRVNDFLSNQLEATKLRSFLYFTKHAAKVTPWTSIYDGFPVLRVLDLGSTKVDTVPHEIRKLVLLRYLRLSLKPNAAMPSSICELSNLQTLEVIAPHVKDPLHKDIWKMEELRHLYYRPGALSFNPPARGNSLFNLQTLVSISPESCKESVLSKLPNLTLLTIVGDLQQHGDLVFRGLKSLISLRTLKLEHLSREGMRSLPRKINFPQRLTKLVLSKTELTEDPMEKLKQIPNLRVLKLAHGAYKGKELNSETHTFPQLQSLALKNLGIQKFKMSMDSMPCLNSLIVARCENLQGLPLALKDVPTLQKLELWYCSDSVKSDANYIKIKADARSAGREQVELVIQTS